MVLPHGAPVSQPHTFVTWQVDRRNWIRIRRADGLFYIYFYNEMTGTDANIRPTLNFEISVRSLSGLLALGYQIGATIHRCVQESLPLPQTFDVWQRVLVLKRIVCVCMCFCLGVCLKTSVFLPVCRLSVGVQVE